MSGTNDNGRAAIRTGAGDGAAGDRAADGPKDQSRVVVTAKSATASKSASPAVKPPTAKAAIAVVDCIADQRAGDAAKDQTGDLVLLTLDPAIVDAMNLRGCG